MNKGTGFDWRSMGKADYSQAAALVASLPEEVRCQVKGVSQELLTRIVHLSWIFAERSGRGAGYCWPTLSTLATYLKRSERTVERHLSVLRASGLISYRRRLNSAGAWTSNLYQIGKVFLASLVARSMKKVKQFRDPTKMATNDLKREYKAGAPTEKPALSSSVPKKTDVLVDETPSYHKMWKPPSWMPTR